ncbi:C-type lectin 37Da-like [Drosophila elegans]|uniref:C-type lectin 37Da-like n=1 Tax=Drosophila elegans TaxID=30023 RepID=UPI0007E7FDEB|nr:C-type lectin 37Da-like [Drosophila elegans]
MFDKYTVLLVILGLLYFVGAYQVIPFIEDGIQDYLNIMTDPFVKIGQGHYYIDTREKKNWFDASETCHRINAHLIAFETIEEWDLVNQYLLKNQINDIYWTSGADLANQGKHDWFYYNGNEHCGELRGRQAPTNYNSTNDSQCVSDRHYICEKSYPITASLVSW